MLFLLKYFLTSTCKRGKRDNIMFGYVLINKPELKIREFEKYRSYYCGLCHALNDKYGVFGRLTLNYDMADVCFIQYINIATGEMI